MPLLGGVRPPVAALLCLLLAVSGATALAIGTVRPRAVPQALPDAERQIAADAAASTRADIEARAGELRYTASAYTPATGTAPAASLTAVTPKDPSVRGVALFDLRTGGRLAARGESLPLAPSDVRGVPEREGRTIAPRVVRAGTGLRLLLFARVTLTPPGDQDDQGQVLNWPAPAHRKWLLAVSEALTAPPVHGPTRGVQLLTRDGTVLARTDAPQATSARPAPAHPATAKVVSVRSPHPPTGVAVRSPHPTPVVSVRSPLPARESSALATRAVAAASASAAPGPASGALLGDTHGDRRTIAGWASVDGVGGGKDASGPGLVVLTTSSTATATEHHVRHTRCALVAGVLLALVALLVTALLVFGLQRPLIGLHLTARRLARGAAGGPQAREGDLAVPVPLPRFGEPRRIARALESLRLQLLDGSAPSEPAPARIPVGTRLVVVVAAVLVAAWSVPMLCVVNRADPRTAVPTAVVGDQRDRTMAAADRVRRYLDRSQTDLAAAASAIAGRDVTRRTAVLKRVLAEHTEYRSVYVLDGTGRILTRRGAKPLRTLVHAPTGNGVTLVNASGRIPAIAAYARTGNPPRPHGRAAVEAARGAPAVLFAEIDVSVLDAMLERPGLGHVWLTDEHHRVLAASVGFRAFQRLPGHDLAQLAARKGDFATLPGTARSALIDTRGATADGASVAAAVPLAQAGPTTALGWQVVSAEQASALRLGAFAVQWHTMLTGLLAIAVGAVCLGWTHLVVVRPLRTLTATAERLAAGDRRSVIYPANHDEIGSVTRALELVRQALVTRDRATDPQSRTVPAETH
ncbi:HAMP domain-containing protein [Streptantibioticus parmotrematis]|uniref:HAMP domain-containing protein n=1 Tax=Streptantibioticus parmotrematis TaxID=2873249 RepID=UPI0033F3F0E4